MFKELRGRVIQGEGKGLRLGYPTANLDKRYFNRHPLIRGVYVVRATIGADNYRGIAIVGAPSLTQKRCTKLEIYFLNVSQNFVGKYVRARVLKRLRDLRRFKTDRALITQIKRDVKQTKKFFKEKQ